MIGIIGTQDDCIGFGLVGVNHRRELAEHASQKDILAAVEELAKDVDTIIIAEQFQTKIRDQKLPDVFFITLPSGDGKDTTAYIESLTKELLGITL